MHSNHRLRILTLLILSGLIILGGCNGFFTSRTDNVSTSGFAFVVNSNLVNGSNATGTVSVFTVTSSTGLLVGSTTTSPVSTGSSTSANGPVAIIAVAGKFLYTANDGGSVSGFTWSTTNGNLTAIAGSPFIGAGSLNPTALITDHSGKFLYVANSGSDSISIFSINATTGVLTELTASPVSSPVSLANFPTGFAIHPSKNVIYVAIPSVGIASYSYDATTGALTFISSVAPLNGGTPQGITIAKNGSFAYVANGLASPNGGVEAWKLDATSGALTTPVAATAYKAHDTPTEVIIDPSGANLIALNSASNDLSMYSINTSTGGLTANNANPIVVYSNSTVTPGLSHITFDPTGAFVYVTVVDSTPANNGTSGAGLPGIIQFQLNTSAGTLTKVPVSSTAQGVQAGNNPAGIILP